MKRNNNVAYGDNPLQTMDLFTNDTNSNGKTIINIHGGGWWQGDKARADKDEKIVNALVDAGFSVANINYRLADSTDKTTLFPAALEDAKSAYEFLLETNFNNCQTNGIGVNGISSGAYQAVYLADQYGLPVVSWSGQFNFAQFLSQHSAIKGLKPEENENADFVTQMRSYYKWILDNLFAGDLEKARQNSLQKKWQGKVKSALLINSVDELAPIDELLTIQQLMLEDNRLVETVIVPGNKHGYALYDEVISNVVNFFHKEL